MWYYLYVENQLKNSAEDLLTSTNIIEILSKFGEVHIVGSYAFDLMTEPDIDLVVITSSPQKSSEDALEYVSKQHLFQKIEYGDFRKFPRENRPPFFIFNMRTPWDGKFFEIEAWFVPEAKGKLDFVEIMKNISNEQKQKILELKIKRQKEGINKSKLSSFEIYQQVLKI